MELKNICLRFRQGNIEKDIEKYEKEHKEYSLIERSAYHPGIEKPYRIYRIQGLRIRVELVGA